MEEKQQLGSIRLVLTRHGQTVNNIDGTLTGHQPGKLTEQGIKQAEDIGRWFRKKQERFDHIYVSDLDRTVVTFNSIISEAEHLTHVNTTQTPLLRQKRGGILEGKPLSMWRQQAERTNTPLRKYKCQGGQSAEQINQRCFAFLKLIIEQHLIKKQKSEGYREEVRILVVSHGGYLRQFHNLVHMIQGKELPFKFAILNCSFHTFLIDYPLSLQSYQLDKVKIECLSHNTIEHLQSPSK